MLIYSCQKCIFLTCMWNVEWNAFEQLKQLFFPPTEYVEFAGCTFLGQIWRNFEAKPWNSAIYEFRSWFWLLMNNKTLKAMRWKNKNDGVYLEYSMLRGKNEEVNGRGRRSYVWILIKATNAIKKLIPPNISMDIQYKSFDKCTWYGWMYSLRMPHEKWNDCRIKYSAFINNNSANNSANNNNNNSASNNNNVNVSLLLSLFGWWSQKQHMVDGSVFSVPMMMNLKKKW